MKNIVTNFASFAAYAAVGWLTFAPNPVMADEVISDDLIVNGSTCVGLGCVADEDFGFDTIRLISDNPQIRFVDTSISAAFPTQDWTMGVDDGPSSTSVFFVKDATTNSNVLQLTSTPSGGVAIGAGAELVGNAVSVGATGSERRIVHVADGTAATDAVNIGQFSQFQTDIAGQLTDIVNRIDALTARLDAL